MYCLNSIGRREKKWKVCGVVLSFVHSWLNAGDSCSKDKTGDGDGPGIAGVLPFSIWCSHSAMKGSQSGRIDAVRGVSNERSSEIYALSKLGKENGFDEMYFSWLGYCNVWVSIVIAIIHTLLIFRRL